MAATAVGTPLATMTVLVDEMLAEEGLDERARKDCELLRGQLAQCKATLSELSATAEQHSLENTRRINSATFARQTLERWAVRRPGTAYVFDCDNREAADSPDIDADPTLAQAMELMQSREFRHLPVSAEDGSLLGFVSDRHLLRSLSLPVPRPQPRGGEQRFRDRLFATQNNQAASGSLALVMDTDPPRIRPEALFVDAIRLMMEQRVSGLPVVDPTQGKVCGVITTTDVLRVFRVVLQIGSHLGEQQGLRAQAA